MTMKQRLKMIEELRSQMKLKKIMVEYRHSLGVLNEVSTEFQLQDQADIPALERVIEAQLWLLPYEVRRIERNKSL